MAERSVRMYITIPQLVHFGPVLEILNILQKIQY